MEGGEGKHPPQNPSRAPPKLCGRFEAVRGCSLSPALLQGAESCRVSSQLSQGRRSQEGSCLSKFAE